jgi:ATP sulfurylase
VVREMRLENGLPWSIPITLAVSEDAAGRAAPRAQVALRARDGRLVAVMDVNDRFRPDKALEASEVYRSDDGDHPGVAHLKSSGPIYLGGEIHVLERALPAFPTHHHDPRDTRAYFAAKGWSRVVGFQTRNPIHRAHEYLTKTALELCDGLLIHPLIGPTRADDVPAPVRVRCYEALVAEYYPSERVLLSLYPAAMRYAGPREAVLHALVRKNYGCSHFIVGRDHAGVGGTYGARDAQGTFATFAPSELVVEPLFFEDAFYSTAVGSMATTKTAPGDASTRMTLSGTKLRELVARGSALPPELVRPAIAKILSAWMRSSS